MKGGRMADMMEIARRKKEREEAAKAAETPPPPAAPIRPKSLFEQAARPGTQSPTPVETGRQTSHPVTQSQSPSHPVSPQSGTQSAANRAPNNFTTGHPIISQPGTQFHQAGEANYPTRKYRERLNLRIPQEISERFEQFCRDRGVSKQDAAEVAIRRLIESNWAPSSDKTGHPVDRVQLGTQSPSQVHDDHDQRLRIIYQEMTGNRATRRDWAALAEIRQLGEAIIREGIRLSVVRAPSPIKSFRYCLGAIWEVATRGVARSGPEPERTAKLEAPSVAPPAVVVESAISVYDVRRIAARFRELHHGESDYTKESLRADVRTALIGEGREPDDRLIDEAIGT
jgi:hypothetical protein